MITRDAPFSVGERYHCYNFSIENRIAFTDAQDYRRFLEILYLANQKTRFRRNDIGNRKFEEVLNLERDEPIVAIEAFCLMTTHFHLVLRETSPGGITSFMRKVATSYTLYFNSRHTRVGNLFLRPFRSRHVPEESLRQVVSYVHCNPAELYEPGWKTMHVTDPQFLSEHISVYPYSSFGIHTGTISPLSALLNMEKVPPSRPASIQKMIQEALKYRTISNVP